MLRILASLIALTFVAGAFGQSAADREQNWRQWRGPDATGFSSTAEPPTSWSEDQNIKWKTRIPGVGGATPIVWGDRVYALSAVKGREAKEDEIPKPSDKFQTQTQRPSTFFQFTVFALDRNTGSIVWQKVAAEKVPIEGHHNTHDYASGSPATDGKRLYVSFGSYGVYAYSLAGELLWKNTDLGEMHTRNGFGEAVTPVVAGDVLLLNHDQESDSALIALDANTGALKWKAPRDEKTSWNTPLVVERKGRTQAVLNGTNKVRSYDIQNGKVLWSIGGMTVNAIPSAVADSEVAYILSGFRGAAGVAVPLDSTGELEDSSLRWRIDAGTPYVPSPLLMHGRLYFTQANSNLLTILDAKSGQPLVARKRLSDLKTIYASPTGAGGKVYIIDRNGTCVVLKEGGELNVLATNRLSDVFNGSPAAVGKTLYLRGDKYMYAIEEK